MGLYPSLGPFQRIKSLAYATAEEEPPVVLPPAGNLLVTYIGGQAKAINNPGVCPPTYDAPFGTLQGRQFRITSSVDMTAAEAAGLSSSRWRSSSDNSKMWDPNYYNTPSVCTDGETYVYTIGYDDRWVPFSATVDLDGDVYMSTEWTSATPTAVFVWCYRFYSTWPWGALVSSINNVGLGADELEYY